MSNHYHLLDETPESDLVIGMNWLRTPTPAKFNIRRPGSGYGCSAIAKKPRRQSPETSPSVRKRCPTA
jgi:hypothetical protein